MWTQIFFKKDIIKKYKISAKMSYVPLKERYYTHIHTELTKKTSGKMPKIDKVLF